MTQRQVSSVSALSKTEDTGTTTESKVPDPYFENLVKAYEAKDVPKVKELLKTGSLPVNYREPTRANRTPLLYAAKFDVIEAVDELLQKGADCNIADDAGVTPLHSAASNGNLKPVRSLLKAGANPNVLDVHGKTPLHYVTRSIAEDSSDNSASCIVQVLLNAGALLCAKDKEDRAPLHSAAMVGNIEILPLLLSRRGASMTTARDKDGRIPLHLAVIGARSLLAVKLLLQSDCQIDAKDNQGRTPLHHVAARPINYVDEEFDGECLELLLNYGASVSAQDDEGHNALSLALQKTMWWSRQSPRDSIVHSVQLLVAKGSAVTDAFDMWRIVETFPSLVVVALNQAIRTNTSAKDSPHLKLKLDFRPLTANSRLLSVKAGQMQTPIAKTDEPPIPPLLLSDNEISMLHYIVSTGHKDILTHPLCSMFLHLKWLKVRKYLVANALYYFLFVLTFTCFVLSTGICPSKLRFSEHYLVNNETRLNTTQCNNSMIAEFQAITHLLLIIFSVTLTIREFVHLMHSPLLYIKHLENYLDITILACVISLLFWTDLNHYQWERNISSILAVFAWARLMLFLGQFPSCGVYIVMFSTVFQTIVKFLAMYLPLLIAFALGLYIILEDSQQLDYFNGFPISIMTTLVMMTGELEYGDKILKNASLASKVYPCVLLVFFILMVYIILSNLLVALAVNDLHGIQQRSEILRLTRQVELMITVETFLRSPLIPKRLQTHLQKKISIANGRSDAMLIIFPNLRHSFTDSIFNFLVSCFGCRPLFIKIFEQWVTNFIPPDPVPSLPNSLIKEAVQLALTELEIEKRDKLLAAKIRQNKSSGPSYNLLGPKPYPSVNNKESFKESAQLNWLESNAEMFSPYTREYGTHLNIAPSMRTSARASIWRASFRRDNLLYSHPLGRENEGTTNENTIEELKKKVQALQNSIECLTAQFIPPPTRATPYRESSHASRARPSYHPLETPDQDHSPTPSSPLLI